MAQWFQTKEAIYFQKCIRRVWRYQREVIRIRTSKKNKHNGKKKKCKRTNNDLQNIHIKQKSSNTNPTKNRGWTQREWGKDREVFTTSGTYLWSFVTQIFHKRSTKTWWRPQNFWVEISIFRKLVSYLGYQTKLKTIFQRNIPVRFVLNHSSWFQWTILIMIFFLGSKWPDLHHDMKNFGQCVCCLLLQFMDSDYPFG